MVDQGLLQRPRTGDLRDLIGRRFDDGDVVTVAPTDTLLTAFNRMRSADLAQLPVVDGGRLVGVLDLGDLNGGDPASDLAVAWMLLPHEHRAAFRAAAGAEDEHLWTRARGWALALGLVILANSRDNPPYAALARQTLDAVLSDPDL
jgi:CBS-domain-containing membrane protein